MTHDEAIQLIQAHKDGKVIQWQNLNNGKWYDVADLDHLISCLNEEYLLRIKPEPKYWVPNIDDIVYCVHGNGNVVPDRISTVNNLIQATYCTYRTLEQAQIVADKIKAIHKEHREVVE